MPRNIKKLDPLAAEFLAAVGSNIRAERERAKLSQRAFAKVVGLSQGMINQIEHGEDFTFSHLPHIASALGVDPSDLVKVSPNGHVSEPGPDREVETAGSFTPD